MTAENKRVTSSAHAQSVLDSLQQAIREGAMGAQYEDGRYGIYPNRIVDKDAFQDMVGAYADGLMALGVPRKTALINANAIIDKFHGGTAATQYEVSTGLLNSVNGINQANATIR